MSFSALGLDHRILEALREVGYTEPTPIQAAAIPPILQGQDIVGIAQTGTGKTAAFTLPLLSRIAADPRPPRGTHTLVLAPTRELVVQIEENVRAYARHLPIDVALVFGGVSEKPQIEALRTGAGIVVATPGRLLDLMGRRHADFSGLRHLVLDEADRMLDMGFLPSIQRVVQALPRDRQTLLFSATLSKEIESLIHRFQRNPRTIQIGRRSNPADTVTQLVYEVPRHLKMPLLVHLLADPKLDMVLAFARTKHSADRLARQLAKFGIPTATLHSNRSQNQRLRALKDFKSGAIRVLVATDIASRGIDVDGISHVVNFDFPMHAEDYVHRIGRTGRAQAVGDAISFVTPDDRGPLKTLEKFIGRGLVRRRAEDFDYNAKAPSDTAPESRGRGPGQRHGHGQPQRRPAAGQPAPEAPRPEPARPQPQPQPNPRGPRPSHGHSQSQAHAPRHDARRDEAPRPWQRRGDDRGGYPGARPGPDRRDNRDPRPAPGFRPSGPGGGRPPRDDRFQRHDAQRPGPRGDAPRRDDFQRGGDGRRPNPGNPGFSQGGPRGDSRGDARGPRRDGPRPGGWRPKFRR